MDFTTQLKLDAPPLASLDQINIEELQYFGYVQFEILHSESAQSEFQPISSDVAICDDCLRELWDSSDRRNRYPFINCTNCGPRFSIIQDIPYDRPNTCMSVFEMCPECFAEYQDPENRRFHAQPIACPNCGPKIWFEQIDSSGAISVLGNGNEAIKYTRTSIRNGQIVAIKGLGGFHLACNGNNNEAVGELRKRKSRHNKPFAVMMPDFETVKQHCYVSEAERALLESPAHPIVLLFKRPNSHISRNVAPGQKTIGVMLPYTPLHSLLIEKGKDFPDVLVMTSGNISDEPICTDNSDARNRLAVLADSFLMHDREILIRVDDSVMRVFQERAYPIRRSRGYAPYPVLLPWSSPSILATGSELKNTFCLTNNNYAFLSQHIGDMENYETLKSFEEGIAHFEKLFRANPIALACDLHPNYLATRYALDRAVEEQIPVVQVQHHHAHLASLMIEHGYNGSRPVIGVAFDGTGFGDDGTIWGGEFLVADYSGFKRAAHLRYFPLPGGDNAIRHPSRTALGLLHAMGISWLKELAPCKYISEFDQTIIRSQLEKKINCPLTSSLGRLFDAAASLAGVCQTINYEAQAAIEFEALNDPDEHGRYEFDYNDGIVDPKNAMELLINDSIRGVPVNKISGKFHNGLASMVVDICGKIQRETSLSEVALSGGVWQNITLLNKTVALLENKGFSVLIHHKVPSNDGGLALGQAAIAAYKMQH